MRFGKRRFWLLALAVVIVLPVAAVGVVVAVIDPNDYKPQVIDAIQAATGRTLILGGPVVVSRSLWPTIEVSDVKLANLPGGTRADMARVERIEAQISLPALLSRRVEVLKLTLIGPNILFEQVGGKPNWTFDHPDHDAAKSSPAASDGPPFELRVRRVHVQNGMVTSKLPARTRVVGIRGLDLQHRADGGPVELSSVLVYADNEPFSLDGSAQPTAGVYGPWNADLRLAAFDTTLGASGTVTLAGDYDLRIEARSGALEKVNALLPEMRLPALRQASVTTHIVNGLVPGDIPVIGETRLHFQSADLADRVPGLTLTATDLALPEAGGTATVSGGGQFSGQPFALKGRVGIPKRLDGRVDIPLDLETQANAASAPVGTAKAGEGSLAVKGKLLLDTLHFAGLDAAVTLRTPALAGFHPLLATSVPALTDVQFAGQVAISATLGTVSFKGAKLVTQQGDVAGDGTIGLRALKTGAAPAVQARLHSTRLDLDAVLTAFGIDRTGPSINRPGGTLIPDTPLPWAAIRGQTIDLVAEVGSLTYAREAWPKAELTLRIKDGVMDTGRARFAMPAGPFDLALTADGADAAVPINLTLAAPGVPLALIARESGLPGPVSGSVRLNAKLHGTGRSLHEFAASLDGFLSASSVGGEISNEAFIQLTAASLDALGVHVPPQGKTALRCFGVVATFDKGIGRLPVMALETTYLQLEGVGEVDLGRETLAFKLQPMAQVAGSPVAVPVLVEGPFRALKGRLDATGLDKLGFLFDALFGGDKPQACEKAGLR